VDCPVGHERLAPEFWRSERDELRQRVRPWTSDRLERGLRGEKHPVYDFLFEYYSYRPAHLERYSPGLGITMEGAVAADVDWPKLFTVDTAGATLPPGPALILRLPAVRWGIRFLRATLQRDPVFHCFGLHEWAMVYRTDEVRHAKTPLRLTEPEITAFVDSQRLCCTHFDAYRFFTRAATPLNRHQLNRYSVAELDQPGCIHVNMDLYKWAFHVAPMTSSRIVVEAFDLARRAREIDMRASPYDLRSKGFEPLRIEARQGREEYVALQRDLYFQAQPIRTRLLAEYERIEALLSSHSRAILQVRWRSTVVKLPAIEQDGTNPPQLSPTAPI
jgi:hypothetical protein